MDVQADQCGYHDDMEQGQDPDAWNDVQVLRSQLPLTWSDELHSAQSLLIALGPSLWASNFSPGSRYRAQFAGRLGVVEVASCDTAARISDKTVTNQTGASDLLVADRTVLLSELACRSWPAV
jgi:hypothetical protein